MLMLNTYMLYTQYTYLLYTQYTYTQEQRQYTKPLHYNMAQWEFMASLYMDDWLKTNVEIYNIDGHIYHRNVPNA